jgi:signal transduction histidine kinase
MEAALTCQSPACHWVLDSDGRFHYASGNTVPLFGHPAASLRGQCLDQILPRGEVRTWRDLIQRSRDGETIVTREPIDNALFGVVCFPLHSPDGSAVYAAGYALNITAVGTAEKALRETTLRMLKAQESERGRLARFLHDEVGQSLSAVGMHLDLMRMDFESLSGEIAPRTTELQAMLETVMAGVREYSYALNPDVVERAGLHAAMDRLVGRTRKLFAGNLRLMADSSLRFPPPVGSAVYKIASEALENALQHSGCSQIEVVLKSTPNGPAMEVRDNGKGFDSIDLDGQHRGLGLLVMEHYAEQAHLRLSIGSEKGKGTTVRVVFEDRGARQEA